MNLATIHVVVRGGDPDISNGVAFFSLRPDCLAGADE